MERFRDSHHPLDDLMSEVISGLARRLRLPYLEAHHDHTAVLGAFAFLSGLISIALMTAAALVTGQPFVFPSLGPTAFLFFYTPLAAPASPRNTIFGHLIGVLSGWISLAVFGLLAAGPSLSTEVSAGRVGAVALSLGLTAGVMVWLRVHHPPAGATTMIVSLGLLTDPVALAVLMLAVVLLTVQAIVINRLAGLDYPLWAPQLTHRDAGGRGP